MRESANDKHESYTSFRYPISSNIFGQWKTRAEARSTAQDPLLRIPAARPTVARGGPSAPPQRAQTRAFHHREELGDYQTRGLNAMVSVSSGTRA